MRTRCSTRQALGARGRASVWWAAAGLCAVLGAALVASGPASALEAEAPGAPTEPGEGPGEGEDAESEPARIDRIAVLPFRIHSARSADNC